MFLKRGQKLTFDIVLRWMNSEHHRVELVKCIPFDYSYVLIGVQMLEFCLLQGLRKNDCYSNSRATVPAQFPGPKCAFLFSTLVWSCSQCRPHFRSRKRGRKGEERRKGEETQGLMDRCFSSPFFPVKSVRHHPLSVLPPQFVDPWLFLMDVPPATQIELATQSQRLGSSRRGEDEGRKGGVDRRGLSPCPLWLPQVRCLILVHFFGSSFVDRIVELDGGIVGVIPKSRNYSRP